MNSTHGQSATAPEASVYNLRKSLFVKAMIICAAVISGNATVPAKNGNLHRCILLNLSIPCWR